MSTSLARTVGIVGLMAMLAFVAIALVPLTAQAQTVPTLTASDTDDIISPAWTAFKTYFKWFLIFAIPVLILIHFVRKAIGTMLGRG